MDNNIIMDTKLPQVLRLLSRTGKSYLMEITSKIHRVGNYVATKNVSQTKFAKIEKNAWIENKISFVEMPRKITLTENCYGWKIVRQCIREFKLI